MKIAFFGTPEFAWNILSWMLSLNPSPREEEDKIIEVALVVSQPDKAIWRKKELQPTVVKQVALDAGIEVMQPEKLKSSLKSPPRGEMQLQDKLESLELDFIVVVAYGKIIPQSILDIPKYGCINLHGSILPKYRGASPVQASIKAWDRETGLTTMYMSKWMDEWDMLLIEKIFIESDDTSEDIFQKFSDIWPDLLLKTIQQVVSGEIVWIPQDNSEATYCGKISREDGEVFFSKQPTQEIYNTYRAYTPWPGIYTWYEGKRLVLEEVTLPQPLSKRGEQESVSFPLLGGEEKNIFHLPWQGENWEWLVSWSLLKLSKNRYGIVCSDWEILEVLRVKLEGKKSMDIQSFVNGSRGVLEYCFG